mmetsp:Transcript_32431/g.52557  ORF Transcript_32431/g.52557 Transcript_32431/m.52557 type:complete len:475 (-) Transcript_32431:79-1503(-)
MSVNSNSAEQVKNEHDQQSTPMAAAVINLVKVLVGAAMLSYPWAVGQSSFIPGMVGIAFSTVYSFITTSFIIEACEKRQVFEYSALLRSVHPMWETFAALILIYICSSSCLSYVILIGDFFTISLNGMGVHFAHDRQVVIASVCVLILLPLSLMKQFKSLRLSSLIGNIGIIYCVSLAIIFAIYTATRTDSSSSSNELVLNDWDWSFLIVLNLGGKAYVAHYPVAPMFEQLQRRSLKRMRVVMVCAWFITTTIYVAFTIAGYYVFGATAQGDVLNNYSTESAAFIAARLAMGFSVVGSYPLIFKSLITTVEDKFFNARRGARYNFHDHPRVRVVLICCVWAVLFVLALLIEDVGPVSSIEGAITVLALFTIFPILIAWKLDRDTVIYPSLQKAHQEQQIDLLSVLNSEQVANYNALDNEHQRHGPDNDPNSDANDADIKKRKNRKLYVTYLAVLLLIGLVTGIGGVYMQLKALS